MRKPDPTAGEIAATVAGEDFILCCNLRHLAAAQKAAGLIGLQALIDHARPSAAVPDYDIVSVLAIFEALAVEGDFSKLETSSNPHDIVEAGLAIAKCLIEDMDDEDENDEPAGDGDSGNSNSDG